jgi:putative membrane protein (TIGR04086 family)
MNTMDNMNRKTVYSYILPLLLGLLIAVFDTFYFTSDDSIQVTLLLLILAGFASTLMIRTKPWRTGLLVGAALPILHVILKLLHISDHFEPDILWARFLLIPIALIAGLVGSYLAYFIIQAAAPGDETD